ncbi:MAG: glycine--tRNA ligase [Phycisphaeraceae bacterium]|nr:glycine--tRNA ligase [Phycisphaeraceae bacterium]
MDAIMALCKRRGFVYQASEIYGGINGFWDYGPLGTLLKRNLREAWWQDMIMNPCWGRQGPDGEPVRCVPVETRIIQHPRVWEASGHVGGFNDPMVDCKACKSRFRADHLIALPLHALTSVETAGEQSREVFVFYGLGTPAEVRQQRAKEIARLEAQRTLQSLVPPLVYLHNYETLKADFECPACRQRGSLTAPRQFNLMFKTYVGATASEDDIAYLRPETAQGIFVQFKNVVDTTRIKVPFGIGNVGTSFRNEVTPRNFTFRSREFEQAELEFFCHPDDSQGWYRFWRDFRMEWWRSIGLAGDNLQLREHDQDELSHYSTGTCDVEYRFPFTAPDFGELEGVAHRGCFDLTQHQEHSRVKLDYFDQERGELLPNGSRKGERYIPHVIEPAAGLDRGALALICEAYTVDESRPSPEIMKFHPRMAPIKAAVFPLVNKDGMPEVAQKLTDELRARFGRHGLIESDPKQSIGKRYARMDEAGCPYCFTIDGDTLTDQTVTVRDRDSGAQERIAIDKVSGYLSERLGL